ncbi:MAG: glycosyltransferase family 1 protein, partial [Deltaproteobacteria bacterium]|nr:glycosyltransferase family 1 protein [Deltaproteobacteria bacterium]
NLQDEVGRRVQENGRRVTTAETVLIYNAAVINLNLHSSVFTNGLDPDGGFVNPRTFEIASCEAFQLVDSRLQLTDFFEPDREIAIFSNVDELRAKIKYYLAHPQHAKDMARSARTRVLAEHTYPHRLSEMLKFISQTI